MNPIQSVRKHLVRLVPFVSLALAGLAQAATIQSYALPASADSSTQFSVTASGTSIPIYRIKTVPASGTTFYTHVAHFSASGAVTVVIDAKTPITSYAVHPTSYGLIGTVDDSRLTLTLAPDQFDPQPTYLIVNINALDELAVLIDPLETDIPASSGSGIYNVVTGYSADPTGAALATTAVQSAIDDASAAGGGVVFVPAGVYKIQAISLESNVTLYLAGGSVLLASPNSADYTGAFAPNSSGNLPALVGGSSIANVTIRGRGWIDANVVASGITEGGTHRRKLLNPNGGSNLVIRGITAMNNASWTINPAAIDSITVTNLKVINPKWQFTDGIDISGSHSLVEKCFVHTGDDAMCSKSTKSTYSLTDVTFQDSVVRSNSAGVKAGMQADGPHSLITFSNIDVVHAGRGCVVENDSDDGTATNPITDIHFANIRVEAVTAGGLSSDRRPIGLDIKSNSDAEMDRIIFDNVTIGNFGPSRSYITGLSATYKINTVTFNNLVIGGTAIDSATTAQMDVTNATNVAFNAGVAPAMPGTAAGLYSSTRTVSLSTTTSGASIRYSTDGTEPNATTGAAYAAPIVIPQDATLRTVAYKSGLSTSPTVVAAYSLAPATTKFEAESMTATGSGQSIGNGTDDGASGGVWRKISSTATGQYIQFTTPSLAAGLYQLRLRYRSNPTRAIHSVQVDGATVPGVSIDQYAAGASTYPTVTIGHFVFATAATHTIRLTVTGKNSSSSGYDLSADDFTFESLAAVTVGMEAESMNATGSGQHIGTSTDAAASSGVWVKIDSTAVGQYIEFTTPPVAAGTYELKFIYRTNPTRAMHSVKIDGVVVGGTIDQYQAGTSSYPTVSVGNVTFNSDGTHTIRLTVTGKNASSSGYDVSADAFSLLPVAPH